jgi:hypothetical protein
MLYNLPSELINIIVLYLDGTEIIRLTKASKYNLQVVPMLKKFDVSSVSAMAFDLIQILPLMKCITMLNLSDAKLKSSSIITIAQAIKEMPLLIDLNLNRINTVEPISFEATHALVQAFPQTLENINFSENLVTSESAILLFESFQSMSKLKTIDMSYNNIDDATIMVINESFTSTSIVNFNLEGNSITRLIPIIRLIMHIPSLITLQFKDNKMNSGDVEILLQIVIAITSITKIDLSNDSMGNLNFSITRRLV